MNNEICSQASFELLLSAKELASSVLERHDLEELFSVALFLVDERKGLTGSDYLTALRTVAERRGFLR